jgi:hypothetical protein
METREVALSSVQLTFFVRKKLDEDRVVQLALLMSNGVVMPPIRLTEDLVLIDGRHRYEAALLAEHKTIAAVIEPAQDKTALIVEAFCANVGGSLPPTRADIMHTIQLLLNNGLAHGKVVDALPFPKVVARRYVADAMSKIYDARVNAALASMRERGLSLEEAAKQYRVKQELLEEKMRNVKRRIGASGYKGNLTNRFRSFSRLNALQLQRLMKDFDEGLVTADFVYETLEHVRSLHQQAQHSFEAWEKRFQAAILVTRKMAVGAK